MWEVAPRTTIYGSFMRAVEDGPTATAGSVNEFQILAPTQSTQKEVGLRTAFFGPASGLVIAITGAAQLLLVQAWYPGLAATWNVPAWSMSVVAFAYLLFPWFAIRLARGRPSLRRLGILLALVWGAALLVPLLYVLLRPDGAHGVTGLDTQLFWLRVLKFNPLVRLPEYLFGMVLGRFDCLRRERARANPAFGAVLSLGAFGVICAVMLKADALPYPLLHNGLLLPAFGALLIGLSEGGGPLAWLLARRPVVRVAETSFSIYVFQWPLMAWLTIALGPHLSSESLPFRAFALVALIALSLASYRLLERPAEQWMRRRFASHGHVLQPASAS
jgi:peptidoglycan/LPS O-acetylase OafA/YrhL